MSNTSTMMNWCAHKSSLFKWNHMVRNFKDRRSKDGKMNSVKVYQWCNIFRSTPGIMHLLISFSWALPHRLPEVLYYICSMYAPLHWSFSYYLEAYIDVIIRIIRLKRLLGYFKDKRNLDQKFCKRPADLK